MNTNAFVLLIVLTLVLGGSLGGAFVGGIALGKNQEEEVVKTNLPAQSPPNLEQPRAGQSNQQTLDELRQQFRSGELSREDLAQLRQQFQGQGGSGAGGGGFAGGGRLTGTIEKIESNTVTVNTPQGPLQATIGVDSTIQRFVEGTLADLEEGTRITIIGQRTEDGTLEVRSILITPEGTGGFSGRGDRRQRDQ